ncbi:MAG: glycine cleavage system protein GcvH [Chloroflexota bacterium]
MYPKELKYSEAHIWLKLEGDRTARIGITDYYQRQLNRVVFIELPEEGAEIKKAEPFGSIESSKTINDLLSPVSGRVNDVNHLLSTNPALTNSDPYGAGWIAVLKISNLRELETLMQAEEYDALVSKPE